MLVLAIASVPFFSSSFMRLFFSMFLLFEIITRLSQIRTLMIVCCLRGVLFLNIFGYYYEFLFRNSIKYY